MRVTLLDLACGTGSSFPYLRRVVGPSGHIIGFDYTPAMLKKAQERVECAFHLYYRRARREETALAEQFGEEWHAYAARIRFMIPFV